MKPCKWCGLATPPAPDGVRTCGDSFTCTHRQAFDEGEELGRADERADESACSNEPDLLVALECQIDAHKRTWLAARASVEGEGVSAVLFENEPSTIAARAAIKKARGGT